MLQDDPMLEGVSAILFDEFHERHLASDLGLALCVDVQSGLREDLRLAGDVGHAGWREVGAASSTARA
jgi:HrpA-like RNA helicase